MVHIRSNYPSARLNVLGDTWIEPEEAAYPNGGMKRKGYVRFGDGKLRTIRCGIPDTYFTVPAVVRVNNRSVRGFVSVKNDEFYFTPDAASPTPVL